VSNVRLGLRENLAQFSLLVVVNAFVGAMVGMERTILPPIAEQEFHLSAKTAVLSFIIVLRGASPIALAANTCLSAGGSWQLLSRSF
jgi:hypothetical protein